MAPISPRNHAPHHHYHSPQKSLLCQRSSKAVQTTSQMVPLAPGLQPAVAGHPWNQNGPIRHTLQMGPHRHYPEQPGNSYMPEPIIIQALDFALAQKVRSSTQSDTLVLRALEALKLGSSLFPHSSKDDWHMTNSHLYFKGQMYIPPHE